MSDIETLLMNEVRETMEKLERSGVGRIDVETMGRIIYTIDGKFYAVTVKEVSQE